MRSKYGADWTQQPSSRLTATLRGDVRSHREAVVEATASDAQLATTFAQYESDLDEMRSAGETDEAEVLFQQAMVKAGAGRPKGRAAGEANLLDEDYGEGGVSVADQVARVERSAAQAQPGHAGAGAGAQGPQGKGDDHPRSCESPRVCAYRLTRLRQVHTDDISSVLILNKKSISNHESQLFQAELEKFRPHQQRLMQANHKQASLLKELSATYGELLQDPRIRAEQAKYEGLTRQRGQVTQRYRKIHAVFSELSAGVDKAQRFYAEMRDGVESLEQNVETFVNNRRAEGAQLLNQIERARTGGGSGGGGGGAGQADRERERLKELMERMTMDPTASAPATSPPPVTSPYGAPAVTSPGSVGYGQYGGQNGAYQQQQGHGPPRRESYSTTGQSMQQRDPYNPGAFARADPHQAAPGSAPAHQSQFSPATAGQYGYQLPQQQQQQQQQQQPQHFMPAGYVPPPPPPGPPPLGPQQTYQTPPDASFTQPRGPHPPQGGSGDPWGGLSAWK